jgi:predicted kinase
MKKIIIVGGFPATGKSAFSRELSQRLRIPCFNKDIVKEIMADGFGIENAELMNRDRKGSAATFMLLLHIAERFMQTGNVCIIESNFSVLFPQPLPESEQMKKIIDKYEYECLTFSFNGDAEVLGQRYVERQRHWVHQRFDKDVIKNYCLRPGMDEINIGRTIKVDTTSFDVVDFEGLYEIANMFMYG